MSYTCSDYKEKYPVDIKIGLSKVCELRPQHCIAVGCRGTHSVCVCAIHQNVKLIISAIQCKNGEQRTYHDLLAKLVCSVDSKLCMIHRCENCPDSENLISYLENILGWKMKMMTQLRMGLSATSNGSRQIGPHSMIIASPSKNLWKQ